MADLNPQQPPQFEKAEYLGQPGANSCAFCKQSISNQYYRIGGGMACPSCAMQIQRSTPVDSHGAFVRALLFGAGGAVLGLVLFAGVEIATGWIIGYVALAVGFIVAKAMQMGSGGVGGRRYQIAAALLTYASVSVAAIPVALHHSSEPTAQHETVRAPGGSNSDPEKPDAVQQDNGAPSGADSAPAQSEASRKPRMGLFAVLGYLLAIGLASPFMDLADPIHGAIGLIILFVGIRIAWQMMAARSPQIYGPFETASTPTP